MSATTRFYEEAAEAGCCPISKETWDYLDKLENADPTLDWIGYTEFDHIGRDGRLTVYDCITVESARRLADERLENMEIAEFLECFGEYCPA